MEAKHYVRIIADEHAPEGGNSGEGLEELGPLQNPMTDLLHLQHNIGVSH